MNSVYSETVESRREMKGERGGWVFYSSLLCHTVFCFVDIPTNPPVLRLHNSKKAAELLGTSSHWLE